MNKIIILSEKFSTGQEKPARSWWQAINDNLIASQKVALKNKVALYRLLATMVNAWLTVIQAINILIKEEKNPVVKKVETRMLENLRSGNNLSTTLKEFPRSFSDSEIAMVESGEKTGQLNKALLEVASQMEKIASLSRKLLAALIYPALIIVVMFGTIFVLMWKVVPQLTNLFSDYGWLPKPTQILVNTSNFAGRFWYLFIFIPIIISVAWVLWRRTERGRYITDGLILKLPGIGLLVRKIVLSKFSRLLASLMGSGVSIVESLRIISGAVGNEVYRQRILLLREDVIRGVTMAKSLENDPLFPDIVVQMIKVGEETAKIDSIIVKVAEFYDEEVDSAVTAINKIIEPVIIVTMAIVVGFMAYAIMTPIMQLSDVITQQ